MQYKALVAIATVLVMLLAALPLEAADPAPAVSDFSTGFYWESNTLNKDKIMEIYGEEGVDIATSIIDSMFIKDYNYWNWSLIVCDIKENDAVSYATFPYDHDDGYYEVEKKTIFEIGGHIKVSFTPAERSIGKNLFALDNASVTGDLKSVIEGAVITEGMELIVDCNISCINSYDEEITYIKNNNGKFIANSSSDERTYYMKFDDAKITCKFDGTEEEFEMDLYDCSYYEHITKYSSAKDPTEKGMKEVEVGDIINAPVTSHNSWDNWNVTITQGGKNAKIVSEAISCSSKTYSGKLSESAFISASELKSLSHVYETWFDAKGGDVTATENFLKSNGHFEKGYECGRYHFETMLNDHMEEDEKYSDYVKDQLKGSSNNTMLYAVSAIAVVLLIALIALAVMYKKKTA